MVLYKFYKIYSCIEPDGLCYIGQTTRDLKTRLREHKSSFITKTDICSSKKVFEKYGLENCIIELIEELDFEDNLNSRIKERELIELHNNCINTCIPTRSINEWCKNNRERSNEIKKNWELRNPEKKKECIKKTNEKRKEANKLWREENKERLSQYAKEKYLKNKEKILENIRQKINCEICNCEINKGELSRHKKSKKHLNNLNNL